MKQMKRFFALLLMAVQTLSLSMTAYAKKDDDDEEQDYSVSDVYFDVSDSMILVGWTVGDSECKYSVQLYDNNLYEDLLNEGLSDAGEVRIPGSGFRWLLHKY